MKEYERMSKAEIERIVMQGGDKKVKLNRAVADYLNKLPLSRRAWNIISSTDYNCLAELFGGLFFTTEIEAMCAAISMI